MNSSSPWAVRAAHALPCPQRIGERLLTAAFALAGAMPLAVLAAEPDGAVPLQGVEVTATRTPEPIDRVPASISVVSGEELRQRGAADLRTALSLVAGVDAPSGGDAGPASAVVSLWGLHEFDAFLLVVDGVPWGGAFNPAISTLDLNDVERIEVLKGAAPVIYGATAFVGVIQVIHYPAGKAAQQAQVSYGSYGSAEASGSFVLPKIGDWRQSLAVSGARDRFSVWHELNNNGKLLYRGAGELGGGTLGFDAGVTRQHIVPNMPTPSNLDRGPNNRDGLNPELPVNGNYEPSDARLNETRAHAVLRYDLDTSLGRWSSTASFAHSHVVDVRGFFGGPGLPVAILDSTDPGNPPDQGLPINAQYQSQDRGVIDSYFETHLSQQFGEQVELTYGADLLYGSGHQQSINGGYCAGGMKAPFNCPDDSESAGSRPVDTINAMDDRRAFLGQFVQLDWKPDERWDVNGGLRLNETHERNTSSGTGDTGGVPIYQSQSHVRPSGSIGASYRAWLSGLDEAVVYADYRNTFKPAALDFGPDVPFPSILHPESARSYEAGVKGRLLDGRLDYEVESFFLHFNNVVNVGGFGGATGAQPLFYNAGSELFRGVELEARYHLGHDVQLAANYSYHLARYGTNVVPDSTSPSGVDDFSGRQQTLSPRSLASLGALYNPRQGFYANAVTAFVGNRYLDKNNTTATPSYITLDATAGYRYRIYTLSVAGYNLTDRRNPATNSEFGTGSFYRLASRRVLGSVSVSFK